MIPRNYLTENEILTKFFSGDCALIKIEELRKLQLIENKFNSISHIISTKESESRTYTTNN